MWAIELRTMERISRRISEKNSQDLATRRLLTKTLSGEAKGRSQVGLGINGAYGSRDDTSFPF